MYLANILTLSRAPALFLVAGCYDGSGVVGHSLALGVFVVAALTDWLDGWVARRTKTISDFGKFMDALLDKILVVGLFAFLAAREAMADWGIYAFLLILVRELAVTGLRLMAASEGVVMAAEKLGKLKTVVQMGCLIAFLTVPLAGDQSGMVQWGAEVLLVASAVLAVVSGAGYFRSYFANREVARV